jgi:hypothetical protein
LSAYNSELSPPYNYLFASPVPPDLVSLESWTLSLGQVFPNPFPISTFGSLFADAQPFTVVDGFLAVPVGNGSFGLRAGLGSRAFYNLNDDSADSGIGETAVTLEAGLSGRGEARYDTSLNLILDFGNGDNAPVLDPMDPTRTFTVEDLSTILVRGSLSGRGFIPYNDNIEVGVLGNIVVTSSTWTYQVEGNETSGSEMGFAIMGGAGPVYRVTEVTHIGGYGMLGVSYANQDPDTDADDNSVSDLLVYIPAVRVAADIGLTNWFFVRGGLQYAFQLANSTRDAGSPDVRHRRDGSFGWAAGLGIRHEGFILDGALQNEWLTEGPDFLGGASSGLFGVISAGYQWL